MPEVPARTADDGCPLCSPEKVALEFSEFEGWMRSGLCFSVAAELARAPSNPPPKIQVSHSQVSLQAFRLFMVNRVSGVLQQALRGPPGSDQLLSLWRSGFGSTGGASSTYAQGHRGFLNERTRQQRALPSKRKCIRKCVHDLDSFCAACQQILLAPRRIASIGWARASTNV